MAYVQSLQLSFQVQLSNLSMQKQNKVLRYDSKENDNFRFAQLKIVNEKMPGTFARA